MKRLLALLVLGALVTLSLAYVPQASADIKQVTLLVCNLTNDTLATGTTTTDAALAPSLVVGVTNCADAVKLVSNDPFKEKLEAESPTGSADRVFMLFERD